MLWLALLILLYCYLEAQFIRVRRDTVPLRGLPRRFDGLTIIHLSDLHCSGFGAGEKRLCKLLREMHGDLVVFTGDYKRRKATNERKVAAALREICHCMRPRFGMFGVLGNKDSPSTLQGCKEAGIEILSGRVKRLTSGKDALYVAGIDDLPLREITRALISVTAHIPDESFRILLSHGPDVTRLARALGYALILCGDTHGGQIRLPLIGAPVVKSQLSRQYCRGIMKEGSTVLCVSGGIGTCAFPLRLLCPPEVRILTLIRKRDGLTKQKETIAEGAKMHTAPQQAAMADTKTAVPT